MSNVLHKTLLGAAIVSAIGFTAGCQCPTGARVNVSANNAVVSQYLAAGDSLGAACYDLGKTAAPAPLDALAEGDE